MQINYIGFRCKSKSEEDIASERDETKEKEQEKDSHEVLKLLLSSFLSICSSISPIVSTSDVIPGEIQGEKSRKDTEPHHKAVVIVSTAASVTVWLWLRA